MFNEFSHISTLSFSLAHQWTGLNFVQTCYTYIFTRTTQFYTSTVLEIEEVMGCLGRAATLLTARWS